PGEYPIGGIAFSDPPASKVSLDRGVTLTLGPGRVPLASALGRAFVGMAPAGRGALIVVGTVAPFLNGQLGIADNGRFALALARELALDPATPFERTLAGIAATDPARAGAAKRLDDALGRLLRDDALLRTVHEIGTVLSGPRGAER